MSYSLLMYPHWIFPLTGANPSEKRPMAEKRFFLLATAQSETLGDCVKILIFAS